MNKGFVSLTILAIIGATAVLSAGGTYSFQKYQQAAQENSVLKEQAEAQKDIQIYQLQEELESITTQDTEDKDTLPLVTYYIKPTKANIRPCVTKYDDKRCAPIGQYDQNDEIELPYLNIESMPEWISVDWEGDEALVNKIVLSQKPTTAYVSSSPTQKQLNEYQREAEVAKIVEDYQRRAESLTAQKETHYSSFTDCLNKSMELGIMGSSPSFSPFMSRCTGKEFDSTVPPSTTYASPSTDYNNNSDTLDSLKDIRDKQKQETFNRTICEDSGKIYSFGFCF
jgi:hypothetical protein